MLEFIDISKPDFDASTIGLDPWKIEKVMHVRQPNGKIITGIDAFAAIWRQLDIFRILIFLVEHQPSRLFFVCGYYIFAMIRPLISKKTCENSTCSKKQKKKSLPDSNRLKKRKDKELL